MEDLVHHKKFDINFSKAKTKFCLSLHSNAANSYLFVDGKKICKFEASNKNNFSFRFCLGNISNEFDHVDSEKYLLREMCMIFQLIVVLLINITF